MMWRDRAEYLSVAFVPLKLTILFMLFIWCFIGFSVAELWWLTNIRTTSIGVIRTLVVEGFSKPLALFLFNFFLYNRISDDVQASNHRSQTTTSFIPVAVAAAYVSPTSPIGYLAGVPENDYAAGRNSDDDELSNTQTTASATVARGTSFENAANVAVAVPQQQQGRTLAEFWSSSLEVALTFINGVRDNVSHDEPWERSARWAIAFKTRYLVIPHIVLLSLYIAITAYMMQLPVYGCKQLFEGDYISSCITMIAPNHIRVVRPTVLDAFFFLISSLAFFTFALGGIEHLSCHRHLHSKTSVRRTLVRLFVAYGFNILGRFVMVFSSARYGPTNALFSFWASFADIILINMIASHFASAANRPITGPLWERATHLAQVVASSIASSFRWIVRKLGLGQRLDGGVSRESEGNGDVVDGVVIPAPGSATVVRRPQHNYTNTHAASEFDPV